MKYQPFHIVFVIVTQWRGVD